MRRINRRTLWGAAALAVLVVALRVTAGGASLQNPVLVLDTARGTIEIELLRQEAPQTVDYIVRLVKRNFYRGLRFHRSERTLIQVGDPTSRDVSRKAWWGQTGTTPVVGVEEFSKRVTHTRGAVGLAHTGNAKFASSHIYIMKAASPALNGKFTIFGRVTKGMDVVDAIQVTDILKLATTR
jgi:cyclophilin family peptidyl-prolyl cis-trans isomerase